MTATATRLTRQYDPFATEAKWQRIWEEQHAFETDPGASGSPYCIVIPPPNVTGNLHMGHAFNMTLLDVLVRYHRMRGDNALCLPGTDHASIAVQSILDKQLQAEGQSRHEIGRERFLERAWQWKQESGGQIVNQLKRLGLSADWSRERFTMDDGLSRAVRTAFIRLYRQGLIYRGKYLVNWCPATQSAVSDLEVESQQEQGKLWQFRYPLAHGEGALEVATTRPETMLGDTAVAVHPEDERYQHAIGKTIKLPIVAREIPVVADRAVDTSFGTGCVKVTPAHDPNDFELGQRHGLPLINIMNPDGTLNAQAGPYAGQNRFQAREGVVAQLEREGLLSCVEDYTYSVPYSDRGKVPIEPLLSTQWFVAIQPLAQQALESLDRDGEPRFVPERWRKVYRDWLVQLKDWCISRQLWWGHQIPAWYVVSETAGQIQDETPFIVADSETEARQQAQQQYGPEAELVRDPDVLDTWFSSGLWPFSTLGWPDETRDLAAFYPQPVLVTGFDIIFFWVARMTMLGRYFTGRIPFRDVYIHGLVRDENGKKMSKSAGNGIDPLLLMDKYGTDALRFTLVEKVTGAGQDISLEYDRGSDESASVEASRNFANKLWNAARFVALNLDERTPAQLGQPDPQALELADRWILTRFQRVARQTREALEDYRLGEAAKGLYAFAWGEFCDWYIELVKPRLRQPQDSASRAVAQQMLASVLDGLLRLLHPFMPHLSEEIWHTLTQSPQGTVLARQPYPDPAVIALPEPAPEPAAAAQPAAAAGAAALVALQVLAAVVAAIHSLLVVAPLLQLLGLGYTVWFAYRYLLWVQGRRELRARLGQLSRELIGQLQAVRSPAAKGEAAEPEATSELEAQFALILDTIRAIRNLRAEAGIAAGEGIPAILQSEDAGERAALEAGRAYIQNLAKVDELTVVGELASDPGQAIADVVGTVQVLVPLSGIADIPALRAKLEKNLNRVQGDVETLTARLNNPDFVSKAPESVVRGAREDLAEAQKQSAILQRRLARLQ
ncbi:MAG: valine--tRNA ligase [Cyanobacteria bacterium QS_8_64_29]|nr:MAG: valine--tRNA ligase [Cyanobacteria bacterium QS_8_64_29]